MRYLDFTDTELVNEMQRRGYIVRHRTDARIPLTWNRTLPFPDGVDFKAEAVEKIRAQITADHLDFENRSSAGWSGPDIQTATLRVL